MTTSTLKVSGFYGIDSSREVIRVLVKKCDGLMQPEIKKFSLDPQITSFEMLQNILARAFDIQSDFTISYLSEDNGEEVYLTMLSDWDMDAAFQNASDPCLRLKVDLKPFDEALEDWDFVTPVEIPQYKIGNFLYKNSFLGNLTGTTSLIKGHNSLYLSVSALEDWAYVIGVNEKLQRKILALEDWDFVTPVEIPQYKIGNFLYKNSFLGNLTGTISNQMERTMSSVQKAIGLKSEEDQTYKPMKAPMTDLEFRNYLDSDGHMVKPEEFRLSIYQGGVEHSLRRVVWRHLLNIFPEELSGRERFDYMKKKENEYFELREKWRDLFNNGHASDEAKHVASLVRKDVMRTDRTHKHYSGTDDNKNLKSLFHLLVTYALSHPEISYCQGMSDLASPLLVVQKEEAQAYLCFCGLMKRLRSNFLYDGEAITTKLKHLTDLVNFYDPGFGAYLKSHGAEDLFFCYRWLLLEMKREFPFDDSMYMLEVMWSTIPPDPPKDGLPLTDPDYTPSLMSMSPHSPTFSVKQTLYAHLLAKRRHPGKESSSPKSPMAKELKTPSSVSESEIKTDDKAENTFTDRDMNLNICNVANDLEATCLRNDEKPDEIENSISNSDDLDKTSSSNSDNTCMDKTISSNSDNTCLDKTISSNSDNIDKAKTSNGDNNDRTKSTKSFSRRRREVERFPSLISASYESSMSSSDEINDAESEVISSDTQESGSFTLMQSSEPVELATVASEAVNFSDKTAKQNMEASSEDESHSQFYLSLEEKEIPAARNDVNNIKKENIPEIKGSFFSGMKKILSSPKKKPGKPLRIAETTSVTNKEIVKPNSVTILDKENSSENLRLANGKQVLEKGNSRNLKTLPIVSNEVGKGMQEKNIKNKQSRNGNCTGQSEEDTLFDQTAAKNIKPKDKSDSDSGNGSLTQSQNFSELPKPKLCVEGKEVNTDCNDLNSINTKVKTGDTNETKRNVNEIQGNNYPVFCENHFNLATDASLDGPCNAMDDDGFSDCVEVGDEQETKLNDLKKLPPPEDFGFGNPFLMFLCLTVLIQHRDFIMKGGMEYDELAMYFDRMVRKHHVHKVLHQTRILYSDYIRMQQKLRTERMEEEQLNV